MTQNRITEKRANELLTILNSQLEGDGFFKKSVELTDFEKVQAVKTFLIKFKDSLINKENFLIESSKREKEKADEVNNAVKLLSENI